jgi:gliding motility-associated-like protein
VMPTLECEVQASNTTICVGDCVDLDAVITGGCGLAASYDWDLGGTVGPPPPPAQCTYSICLYDTFGDGWNGGSVTVIVNGVAVLTNITLNNGSGPLCFDFNVIEGQTIQVNYTAGSWSAENYYRIFSGPGGGGTQEFGTTVGQTPPATTNPPNNCGDGSGVTGDPSISVCPTETTTYTVTITEQCSGQVTTCDITINVLPPPIAGTASISDIEVCSGQTVDLSIVGHDGLVQWQSSPNPGGPWTNIPGATSDNYTTDPLAASTCYQAVIEGCGPSQVSNEVCVTVIPGGLTGLNCPANLSAICDISEQPPYATWNDFLNAGGSVNGDLSAAVVSTFSLVSEVSDGNNCPETITRTYEVSDDCGSTVTCEQTIIVNDIVSPTASNPPTIVIPGGVVPGPNTGVVTDAADNCTTAPTVAWVSDVSDGNDCPETITRTYSVTDDCGNQTLVEQLILITDPFPPTASNPAPIEVQCISDVPAPDIDVVTDADDNSGVAIVTWEDDTSNGQTCPEVINRRYRVTDDCGSFIFVEQTITINDDIAPTGNAPSDITVACPTDVPAPNTNLVTGVSDNCTVNPTVEFVSDVSNGNTCNGEVITRTYSITDDCGNQTNVTQLITIDAITPVFGIDFSHPTACNTATGSITLTGLSPNSSYEFGFNGNAMIVITTDGSGSYTISNLTAGSYSPLIVQPVGCPDCVTTNNTVITLVDPNAPFIDAGNNQTVCDGTPVTVNATNPEGATISWDGGVNDGVAFNAPIGTTTYTVTANLNNCISNDNLTITVHPIPNVNAGNDVSICPGETVVLTGSGANSYSWDNGVINANPFSPTQTTVYTVTGTSNGCSNTDQVTVTVFPQPNITFEAADYVGCAPVTVSLFNTTPNVSNDNCIWTIEGSVLNGCDASYTFTNGGCYSVGLTITSEDGCTASSTIQNFICIDNYPLASFQILQPYVTTMNGTADFFNSSIGASSYAWSFGDGNTSNESDPSHTYVSDEEDQYVVQMIAYSPNGCADTAFTVIQLREELVFYIPNSFTPDGDQYNERFLPIFTSGFNPFDYHLTLFNRWGEIIFESYDSSVGWDGTYRDKLVQDGTYIWKIEFKTKYTDERQVHTGHVNLIR